MSREISLLEPCVLQRVSYAQTTDNSCSHSHALSGPRGAVPLTAAACRGRRLVASSAEPALYTLLSHSRASARDGRRALRLRPRHQLGHLVHHMRVISAVPVCPVVEPVGCCVGCHSCHPHSRYQGKMTVRSVSSGSGNRVVGGGSGIQPASTPRPLYPLDRRKRNVCVPCHHRRQEPGGSVLGSRDIKTDPGFLRKGSWSTREHSYCSQIAARSGCPD